MEQVKQDMEVQDFIGKVVIGAESKKRYVLRRITAPYIEATTLEKNAQGHCASYRWPTINGDPITTGALIFEDVSLTEPFKEAYEAYSHTQDAYWENYGYWMRRD